MRKLRQNKAVLFGCLLVIAVFVVFTGRIGMEFARQSANDRLINAIKRHDVRMVRESLKIGANPNARDTSHRGGNGIVNMIKGMFDWQRDRNDAPTALGVVFNIGQIGVGRPEDEPIETVRTLLDSGANPNCATRTGFNSNAPLATAIAANYDQCARLLIDHGANVNAANEHGGTALRYVHTAVMARLLLDHGAKVDSRDDAGSTPVMIIQDASVARVLLEHGADASAKDNQGRSVEWCALLTHDRRSPFVLLIRQAAAARQNHNYRRDWAKSAHHQEHE